ncbi:MAG: tyrosine--tRNA ligase [bacterium]
MTVITDKSQVEELMNRGTENVYPNREYVEKGLISGKRLRIYCGFDPTAESLHIGNAIQLSKLAQFQKLGHEIIFLIGDFTGMIGDPTDKTATRKKLTREDIEKNLKNYKKQASAYIDFAGDNPALVKYNNDWLGKLTFADLIEVASHFTVGQMIVRDMFQKRIEENKPIHLHEFLYPLAQGFDSVAMDVDGEVGGNDQTFNMLAGRDLMKSMQNKEKFVVTTKLLTDDQGKKMGKSEGNIVFLNEEPNEMYGKVMSWVDGVLMNGFELCTNLPMAEVTEMHEAMKNGANPRDYKMRLAFEITKINHGEKKALEAQENFVKTVQNKEIPDEIEEVYLPVASYKLVDLLVQLKLASSKSEARRLIEQGGIKLAAGEAELEVNKDVNADVLVTKEGLLIQRGKRQFLKVRVQE